MKKIKNYKIILSFCLVIMLLISISFNVSAKGNKTVILGGHSIGLKLDTGVYVAGLYEVETKNGKVSPWIGSNIKEGDKIVRYNEKQINNNNELLNELKNENNNKINLTIDRNGKQINTSVDVVMTKNNHKSIGLYIKDRILGIGTMTFIDPDTLEFASLGHAVYDDNLVIGTQKGSISKSSVDGIKKGISGEAGEKRASITNQLVGSIKTNIGHTCETAGLAGVAKVIVSMQHKHIPKNLHFNQLNPERVMITGLTILNDTPLMEDIKHANFIESTEKERIMELISFLEELEIESFIDATHASNVTPIFGRVPENKKAMIKHLKEIYEKYGEKTLRNKRESLNRV